MNSCDVSEPENRIASDNKVLMVAELQTNTLRPLRIIGLQSGGKDSL
jgi:hypothetical protein